MGNTATTMRPPVEDLNRQDILTQIGYSNKIIQHNENLMGHVAKTNDYLYWLMFVLAVLGAFFLAKYVNDCINGKIERRARAHALQTRRLGQAEAV